MTLDQLVTAEVRRVSGYRPDPEHADFLAAFYATPALLDAARAEVTRLAAPGGYRILSMPENGCHESRLRHDTLVRMLAVHAGTTRG